MGIEKEYKIQRFRENDIHGFRRLWKIHFGEEAAVLREETLNWILKGNPFSRTHDDYFIARSCDGVIGYHGSMPFKFFISGRNVDTSIHFDALIDPAFRGRGILSSLLVEMARNELPFTIALWLNRNSSRVYERFGWRPVSNIYNFVRVYDCSPYIKKKIGKIPVFLKKILNNLLRGIYKIEMSVFFNNTNGSIVREIDNFDEQCDALFHEIKEHFQCIAYRTHDVLNWKYSDKSGASFKKIICLEKGIMRGYAVYQKKKQPDGAVVATILDYLCSPVRKDIFKFLLNNVIRQIEKECPSRIDVLSSNPVFSKLFKEKLFFSTGENTLALKVKNIDFIDESHSVLDGMNWFFTYGDGDWVFWNNQA